MTRTEKTRKQLLKDPDRFITFSGKLIAFGRSNSKTLLIGAGVVVALLLTLATVRHVSIRNENQASALVEKALSKYTASLADTDPKTAYEAVRADFNGIFKRYDSKQAVNVARILYGDISYKGADADTAIAMYTQALDDFGHSTVLKNIILNGLGYAQMLKKDYPESIRYFEMISNGPQRDLKDSALFNLAWIYETTGEKEKSDALYKTLLTDFPDTMYSQLVKEKVNG
jgi:tetratricopeptide (TPR) repeat protein